MKRHYIKHFASESDHKAAVVERLNRTIKTLIFTYLSDRGTVCLVDVIQKLVCAYNNSRPVDRDGPGGRGKTPGRLSMETVTRTQSRRCHVEQSHE